MEHALANFERSNIWVKVSSHITKVEPGIIHTKEDREIRYNMLIWATGNKQVPLVDTLKVSKGNRLPRILSDELLHPLNADRVPIANAFAIGDAADVKGGELPTTTEVACQKGRYVAKRLDSGHLDAFVYSNRVLVAYAGGHDGVVAGQRDWSGPGAWLARRSEKVELVTELVQQGVDSHELGLRPSVSQRNGMSIIMCIGY